MDILSSLCFKILKTRAATDSALTFGSESFLDCVVLVFLIFQSVTCGRTSNLSAAQMHLPSTFHALRHLLSPVGEVTPHSYGDDDCEPECWQLWKDNNDDNAAALC